MLEYFELDKETLIGTLSTGQQKKVQIISALSSDTKMIIIDEITAVLDPETRYRFFSKISEFNKKFKKTIILATNIVEDLKNRVDNILYINGESCELLNPNQIDTIFKLDKDD